MAGGQTPGIWKKKYAAGESEILHLNTIGCTGCIAAQGNVTLEASDDGVTPFHSETITTKAGFGAVGPYSYLHVSATADSWVTIQ